MLWEMRWAGAASTTCRSATPSATLSTSQRPVGGPGVLLLHDAGFLSAGGAMHIWHSPGLWLLMSGEGADEHTKQQPLLCASVLASPWCACPASGPHCRALVTAQNTPHAGCRHACVEDASVGKWPKMGMLVTVRDKICYQMPVSFVPRLVVSLGDACRISRVATVCVLLLWECL